MWFFPPNVEKLKAAGKIECPLKALGYEKDWDVREAAAEAMGELKDPRTVEPLIKMVLGDGVKNQIDRNALKCYNVYVVKLLGGVYYADNYRAFRIPQGYTPSTILKERIPGILEAHSGGN